MSTHPILETVLKDQCRRLHLPSVSPRCMSLEQEAVRTSQRHSYLSSLLEHLEARFPQVKRLSDFRFEDAPTISATQIAQLAEGTYIERAENVLRRPIRVAACGYCRSSPGQTSRSRKFSPLFSELGAVQNALDDCSSRL